MDRFVQSFAQAIKTGRFEAFLQLLTENAVLLSDGGGKVLSAIHPIKGRERITAFFTGIAGKGSLRGDIHFVRISGQRGILLLRENKPPFAFVLAPDDRLEAIHAVYMISNPEKLTRVSCL